MDFSPYAAVLLDLDGTLYHEEHALPGAVDLVRHLRGTGKLFACLSNSTSSPRQLVIRLERLGMPIEYDRIYTAVSAAADYVVEQFTRPRVLNLGGEGLQDLLDSRVDWVGSEQGPCDAVVVGVPLNPFAGLDRLRVGLRLLRSGAKLIGICADRVYPSPRGIEFGAGGLTSMLAYSANVKPIYCGKPEPIFYNELCHRLKVAPSQCILIGDNLEADIAGGKAMGMATVLTLSGVARRQDLEGLSAEKLPDRVVDDLRQI